MSDIFKVDDPFFFLLLLLKKYFVVYGRYVYKKADDTFFINIIQNVVPDLYTFHLKYLILSTVNTVHNFKVQ